MNVTYEIENGEKVKVMTCDNGSVYKYDVNGNVIYYKNSDGDEAWSEYDKNGRMIHFKNSDGVEYWYDANGNKIHSWDNHGFEYWY